MAQDFGAKLSEDELVAMQTLIGRREISNWVPGSLLQQVDVAPLSYKELVVRRQARLDSRRG